MMPVSSTNSDYGKTSRRKRDRGRSAFIKGFAEGFGSVGFVCLHGETMPSQSALFSALLQAPSSDRQAVVATEIWRMATKYTGRDFANKAYFAVWSSEDGRSRDSKMTERDFANAISKLDV